MASNGHGDQSPSPTEPLSPTVRDSSRAWRRESATAFGPDAPRHRQFFGASPPPPSPATRRHRRWIPGPAISRPRRSLSEPPSRQSQLRPNPVGVPLVGAQRQRLPTAPNHPGNPLCHPGVFSRDPAPCSIPAQPATPSAHASRAHFPRLSLLCALPSPLPQLNTCPTKVNTFGRKLNTSAQELNTSP